MAGTGLNLQNMCWRVHIFESSTNLGVIYQAIGRVRRLGNPNDIVFVYEYSAQGTLDDIKIRRNIEKAIPEAAATLNRAIFNEDDADDGEVYIAEWCVVDGKLVKYAEAPIDALDVVAILTPHELLRFILLSGKGQAIDV